MYDFAIIGGGIVGLATGAALGRRYPLHAFCWLKKKLVLLSSRRAAISGVIHSGILLQTGQPQSRIGANRKPILRALLLRVRRAVWMFFAASWIVATSLRRFLSSIRSSIVLFENGVPATRRFVSEEAKVNRTACLLHRPRSACPLRVSWIIGRFAMPWCTRYKQQGGSSRLARGAPHRAYSFGPLAGDLMGLGGNTLSHQRAGFAQRSRSEAGGHGTKGQ